MSFDSQSPDTPTTASRQELVQRLRELDDELPAERRAPYLAVGESLVPDLIVLLEEIGADEAGDYGWPQLNAADLLGALGDARAIPVMLDCLAGCEGLDFLNRRLVDGLVGMGDLATEACLEAYATQTDEDLRDCMAEVLCHAETRDERIFDVLLDTLERSPELGAMYLAEYGDPRAIAALSQAFDTLTQSDDESMLSNHVYVELQEAIEELGGALSAAQSAKAESADEPRRRFMEQVNEAVNQLAAGQRRQPELSPPHPNPGRQGGEGT